MIYDADDYLALSGIQHFEFCRRQWALIHIECLWVDNTHTVEGNLLHKKCHDDHIREKRGNTLIIRGLRVSSQVLGFSGICDVVEFEKSENGINLHGEEGFWSPYPVEYKKGHSKSIDADRMQLCAEAMCLEEMLCCSIGNGALYYGESKRRDVVEFDERLRIKVIKASEEMHKMYRLGYTPVVEPSVSCSACSLKDYCLSGLKRKQNPHEYLSSLLENLD